MREGQEIMKAQVAVEGKDAETRRHAYAAEDIKAHGFQSEIVLAQVFIEEGQEQEKSRRASQTGEQTKETDQPPMTLAHMIDTEYTKTQKERFIIGCSKEESRGKYGEIQNRTVGAFGTEILSHQTI